jgi:hypothetical protein
VCLHLNNGEYGKLKMKEKTREGVARKKNKIIIVSVHELKSGTKISNYFLALKFQNHGRYYLIACGESGIYYLLTSLGHLGHYEVKIFLVPCDVIKLRQKVVIILKN